jgi:tRNA A37 threonylcarbamoyladenosine dehydratase
VLLYDPSSEDEILSGSPDFVLDCIDNIDTKVMNTASAKFLILNIILKY